MTNVGGDTVEVASFVWSSSNELVATVDSAGLVTAVTPSIPESRNVSRP
jgi:uncharacterized protein YjdB